VFVSCPTLLNRYQRIIGKAPHEFKPYSYSGKLPGKRLFFNLGFLTLDDEDKKLKDYFPDSVAKQYPLVVVDDNDMAMIHDMGLYRQSRVALEDRQKKAKKGAFFNLEALPEGTILIFPLAMREKHEGKDIQWDDYLVDADIENLREFYFGGLESIGFGRTNVTVKLTEAVEGAAKV
jgi:CRISPR-associated protein Cmr4